MGELRGVFAGGKLPEPGLGGVPMDFLELKGGDAIETDGLLAVQVEVVVQQAHVELGIIWAFLLLLLLFYLMLMGFVKHKFAFSGRLRPATFSYHFLCLLASAVFQLDLGVEQGLRD